MSAEHSADQLTSPGCASARRAYERGRSSRAAVTPLCVESLRNEIGSLSACEPLFYVTLGFSPCSVRPSADASRRKKSSNPSAS